VKIKIKNGSEYGATILLHFQSAIFPSQYVKPVDSNLCPGFCPTAKERFVAKASAASLADQRMKDLRVWLAVKSCTALVSFCKRQGLWVSM